MRCAPRTVVHALAVLGVIVGCDARPTVTAPTLTVFAAGSLARPLRAALDSIVVSGGPRVQLEVMGSREMLRAVTSLGRTPDLLVTADADELEAQLMPTHVSRSTTFARNRVVLALSPRSPRAAGITTANWTERLSEPLLRVARADPRRAPLGYRTQLVWRLAEIETSRAGLAGRLAASAPAALLRGNEADLAALLETGNADAAWCYESLARAMNLSFIRLGDRIDLGSVPDSAAYRRASVRIAGALTEDSTTVTGAPIRYAMAVVRNGAHVSVAQQLQDRLLDAASRRIMRRMGLDVLDTVAVHSVTANMRSVP
ncbi:MAG: extracellular solute-binding protein [Gemmatimonadaceae bacterium]|nr:extracellular solute-binding protein [Gemmatimonadaceae bacterium]